uniref:Uncharacterized protein n=1 Tax=Lactuca sativa TaxID=4236 RepID=A0A9R1VC71_LACSA|nr:hypothetical protein LSAT_V11C500242360 [Lactuca sativa]
MFEKCFSYTRHQSQIEEKRRRSIPDQKPSSSPSNIRCVTKLFFFHAYNVQHRFYNLILNREFWSSLFRHTHNGWLDEAINGNDWRAFMYGITTYPDIMVPFMGCGYVGVRLKILSQMELLANLRHEWQKLYTKVITGRGGTSQ